MSFRNDLIARIEDFQARTGLSANQIGLAVAHDAKFLWRLRGGHSHFAATLERAEAFMAAVDSVPRGELTRDLVQRIGDRIYAARPSRVF